LTVSSAVRHSLIASGLREPKAYGHGPESQAQDGITQMQKILIIEDHPDMRELLSWQIELMGFVPIAASHGQEGVEKAIAEKPQLILMDIMMPGMDGWQVTRALRATPETRGIPILAATALFRDEDLNTCMEAGCTSYIVKPFTFRQLQNKIREILPPSNGPLPSSL